MLDANESPEPVPEKVSKLEGAERLLKTGIRLFFENSDMLAVHALAAGAHEVLRTLLIKRGLEGSRIKDNDLIRPEYAKEYRDHMNRAQNFLKHADRDPHGILDFYPDGTAFWIFDCVDMYRRLTGGAKYKVFEMFTIWFFLEHPHYLKESTFRAQLEALQKRFNFSKSNFADLIRNPSALPLNNLI